MDLEGNFTCNDVMDKLTAVEQLIATLEAEVANATEADEVNNIESAAQYDSVIRFDGSPILPPFMTKARREEMQFYKQQALMKEAKLKSTSHKKLLETVQQVISRLEKKKDDVMAVDDTHEGMEVNPKTIPPDKGMEDPVSSLVALVESIQIPDEPRANTDVPLDNNLPEPTASPRSAVGDSGISSDLQQITSPRFVQTSTLETVDTLAEITDMSTDFESDVPTSDDVDIHITLESEALGQHGKAACCSTLDSMGSLSENSTLVEHPSSEVPQNPCLTELPDIFRENVIQDDARVLVNDVESQSNLKGPCDNTLKINVSSTKISDCSQSSSETMSVTVISRDGKEPIDKHLSEKEGQYVADMESESPQDSIEIPAIIEIDSPPAAETLSRQSQTEDQALRDSLESPADPQEGNETGNAEQKAALKDSLELGSTLLSRVALSDNEDSGDSTLDGPSDVSQAADISNAQAENVASTAEETRIDNDDHILEEQDPRSTENAESNADDVSESETKEDTVEDKEQDAPELFPGQTQKLMVLQKLNTLLEQVESKTSATKPKSILRTPEKTTVTPSEVVSPGPDTTPDVSVISYADSCVSVAGQQNYDNRSLPKPSNVAPQPAISPYPKSEASPPSNEQFKSHDNSVLHTASTELGRYMTESASMDTINSVSTLPHVGVANVKEVQDITEVPPTKKDSSVALELLEQDDDKVIDSSVKGHRRQGSYNLDKPSPALLQSVKLNESKTEKSETFDAGCTSSMEDLRLRPVHRRLHYDNESTPSPLESKRGEKSAKEEHLHRYLQQLGQMPHPSPSQPPPSVTPSIPQQTQAHMLHDQMKYFEQMKDHMMLLHQQQLSRLFADQQRQQLILQQQFLQQEQQLRQQLSTSLVHGESLNQSAITPEVPPMSMTLPIFGMPAMVPTMPLGMPTSMASFSHPVGPNLTSTSMLSSHDQVLLSNTSLQQVQPGNMNTSGISISARDQTSQPNDSQPSQSYNSSRVCFSSDTTTTPAQTNSPGVQVHYYTPEHSSPPSPEVDTVVRRPVSAPSPSLPSYHQVASPSFRRLPSEISRRPVKINLESLSDDVLHKFNRVTAAVRGYLARRLLKTQKVQQIITTIRDTAMFALSFQAETPIKQGVYSSQDVRLQDRVLAQLTAAMYEINEIFVQITTEERMAIIAQDRQLLREKLFKAQKLSAEKKISAATKRAMERKKRARLAEKSMLELSFRPKSAPPSARSPRSPCVKHDDISGPIKRNYQFMISRAMPKSAKARRSANSPLKPVKDNFNRSVVEKSKTKTENSTNQKPSMNTKKMGAKPENIVRKTVTLSSREINRDLGRDEKTEPVTRQNQTSEKNVSVANRQNNAAAKKGIQESRTSAVAKHPQGTTHKSRTNSSHWK